MIKEVAGTLYEINGGLIFIGTVVSIILFIGTFLMMYYKMLQKDMRIVRTIKLCNTLV